MGLSVEDAALLTGTTRDEVLAFEYGLSGIVYKSDKWVIPKTEIGDAIV